MIQLNGIKHQVYLDTSLNKTPVKLPESNYRGSSTNDFAINKYNDHNVILFGRKTKINDINFFELLLKQKGITPEELVTKTFEENKILGKGKEAEVFEIPLEGFDNFLLRRHLWDKLKPAEDFTLSSPANPFFDKKNIGTVVATIGPYQIINKIEGKGLDAPLNFIREDAELKYRICLAHEACDPFFFNEVIMDLQRPNELTSEQEIQLQAYNNFKDGYIEQLKTLAKAPISSYVKMFEDIKAIYKEGFGLDCSLSNLFYDKNSQKFGFIDLDKEPDSDLYLCKHMESVLATALLQYIDFESQKEAKVHSKEIVKKLYKACTQTGFFNQAAFNSLNYRAGIDKT